MKEEGRKKNDIREEREKIREIQKIKREKKIGEKKVE